MTNKERSIDNIKRILILINCEDAIENVVRACENCSKPDWISVEDELPEEPKNKDEWYQGVGVITAIVRASEIPNKIKYTSQMYFINNQWFDEAGNELQEITGNSFNLDGKMYYSKVTHWLPLLEYPE